ncbi:hypothetical protein [Sphingomonas adhaesiva]|uniref:hypothetical protein n=1 Tax=Sphingomonas adhaesiva TaxID=28212 RepID=UPI002FF5A0DC
MIESRYWRGVMPWRAVASIARKLSMICCSRSIVSPFLPPPLRGEASADAGGGGSSSRAERSVKVFDLHPVSSTNGAISAKDHVRIVPPPGATATDCAAPARQNNTPFE